MSLAEAKQQNYERAAAAVPNGRRRFDRILNAPTSNMAAAQTSSPKPKQSLQSRLISARSKQETAVILMDAGKNNPKELAKIPGSFDLSGVDLSKYAKDARYLPFMRVNLSGANLTGAQLQNADMRNAKLDGAVLAGADMTNAKLGGADLNGAKANGASFRHADLGGAKVAGAQMTNCNLENAAMVNVKGRGLSLDGSYGNDLKLSGEMPDATMRGCNFTGAAFAGDFTNADTTGTKLTDPKGGLAAFKNVKAGTEPNVKYGAAGIMTAPTRPANIASAMRKWGLEAIPTLGMV